MTLSCPQVYLIKYDSIFFGNNPIIFYISYKSKKLSIMFNFWFRHPNGFPIFTSHFQENLNPLYWPQISNSQYYFPSHPILSFPQIYNQQNQQSVPALTQIHTPLKIENQQKCQVIPKKIKRAKYQKQDPKTQLTKKISYLPSFSGQDESNSKIQKINYERNLMSNAVHQLFSFILNQSRSKKQASIIIQQNIFQQNLNLKKFYLYTKIIRQKLSSYLTEQSLDLLNQYHDVKCQLYSSEQQENFLKLLRILALRFLRYDSNMVILTSNRMGSKNRRSHIKLRRKLRRLIQGLKKESNNQ